MRSPFMLLPIAAALLLPASAIAKSEPPVGCVYAGAIRGPREPLAVLVRGGMQPKTNDEKALMARIGATVGACRTKFGWGPKRQDPAVRYMTARILREDALYQAEPLGLSEAMLDGVAGKLDPASRASVARGSVPGPVGAAAFAHLKEAGLAIDAMPAADQQKLGAFVGQGLAGTIMMEDAVAAFNG